MKRTQSMHERMLREHHANVRKLRQWCTDHYCNMYDFATSRENHVCILSLDEYDIGLYRKDISENHECVFLDENDYLKKCDEELA